MTEKLTQWEKGYREGRKDGVAERDRLAAKVAELEKWIEDVKHNDEPEYGAVAADWVWRCEHNVKRANEAESRLQRAEEALREIAHETSLGAEADRIMQRIALAALAGEDNE